jgi:FtsH-binding integral membrane protein
MLIFHSEITALFIAVIALIVFLGFIIYDLKIVEPLADFYGEDKAAIYSAFQLYIDFINVFIRLLQLFGKRRD